MFFTAKQAYNLYNEVSNMERDVAISQFYRAYQVTRDNLIGGAVRESHLKFAPKSDSSTQKFIIKYNG